MSGDSEGFDRAPGAGRFRGTVSGPGHGDVNKLRQPELADGASVFSQCEPLRQPRTAAPTVPPAAPTVPPAPSAPSAPTPDRTDSRSSSTSESVQNDSRVAAVKTRPVQEFTLSASAPEFFPSTYTYTNTYLPVQDDVYEDDLDVPGYDPGYDPGYYPDMSLAELVQDIMAHLSSSPGSFETDIDQITATLNSWVTTEETLHELVELIFTQSTSIPNFTYTGARLCNFLSHHLALSPASGNFRQLLLQRCRTEFDRRQQVLMGDQETQRKFHNYVLFLGELYLSLEVKRGTLLRADILLSALKDLMVTLFSQPNDANLICAIKLLKLTGSVLEDAWRQSSAFHMDTLMDKMKNIVLDGNCSRDVKQMMLKLVELRSSNWGRVHAAASYSEATPDNDPNYYMNEPTFYTADGTPFTAADPEYSEKYQEILDREDYFPECFEENGNEALSCEEDEMEPEMMEAFEKFCQETERKRKT